MLFRFLVPLSVGGAFVAVKFCRETRIRNAAHAVQLLNENINTKAAIRYLETLESAIEKHTHLCNLSAEARFQIALAGSNLCDYAAATGECSHDKSVALFEDALKKLDVDEEWKAAIGWLMPHLKKENNPTSYKYFLKRRRYQDLRLNRFIAQLARKTEVGFGRKLIEQDILSLLMQLFIHFRTSNQSICLNAFKIVANIAMQDEFCAKAIANSEWLPKLASMVTSDSLEEALLAKKICINGISVFGETRKRLRSDVYELFCPEKEPVIDLVLMHGIRGSVFWTWREKDNLKKLNRTRCWPRSWLPQDVKIPLRILAVDYSTSLVHLTGAVESLKNRAQKFSSQLKDADVGNRPIIFICHSLGGLLVKRLLLDDEEIRKRTVGVLFMATPHRGSPYAMFASLGVRVSNDVKLLHQQSKINRQLHQDFLKIIDSIPIISSIAETEKAPLVMRQKGVLVPPGSAYLERGSLYHISDIHHNICKPESREDRLYGIILQFISDSVCFVRENGNKF